MIPLINHSDHDTANNFEDLAIDERPLPSEIIDKLNGWEERGSPEHGFTEREEKKITLQAEQMAALWQWLLGYKVTPNTGKKEGWKGNIHVKEIGIRVLAMLIRLRPDLLSGMSQTELAKTCKVSRALFSYYSLSFAKSFPAASKTLRKTKSVNAAKIAGRH